MAKVKFQKGVRETLITSDPRKVQAYKDSLDLYNSIAIDRAKMLKTFDFVKMGPILIEDQIKKIINKKNPSQDTWQGPTGRLMYGKFKINKTKNGAVGSYEKQKQYNEYKKDKLKIKPIGWQPELMYGEKYDPNTLYNYSAVYPKPVQPYELEKRKPIKIDKIEPKQASFSFTPPEDNRKLNMIPTSKFVDPEGSPASILRYPAQNQGLFGKIKSKITGKNPMPYWMDKQGVKRYPHLGENNPEQVKQIQMLKGDLNPKVPEDAAELKRIDKLLADPALRNKMATSFQNGVREANSYTFGKEPGVGRAIGKVLTGFADDKGKGYSISPTEVMKNLAMPASLLSSCTTTKSSGKARCRPPKNPGYINSIRR